MVRRGPSGIERLERCNSCIEPSPIRHLSQAEPGTVIRSPPHSRANSESLKHASWKLQKDLTRESLAQPETLTWSPAAIYKTHSLCVCVCVSAYTHTRTQSISMYVYTISLSRSCSFFYFTHSLYLFLSGSHSLSLTPSLSLTFSSSLSERVCVYVYTLHGPRQRSLCSAIFYRSSRQAWTMISLVTAVVSDNVIQAGLPYRPKSMSILYIQN